MSFFANISTGYLCSSKSTSYDEDSDDSMDDVEKDATNSPEKSGLHSSASGVKGMMGSWTSLNKSYKSQESNGSIGSHYNNSMTDAEREAAGAAKLRLAFAGGHETSTRSLKSFAKELIVAKRLSDITRDDELCEQDSDLVPPAVVLELWNIVANGSMDGTGKKKMHP